MCSEFGPSQMQRACSCQGSHHRNLGLFPAPDLISTIAGLRGIDPFVISSATGMGLTNSEILFKVELPAFPVVFAGIRTAVVASVGTAIIATFIGASGRGDILASGKNTSRFGIIVLAAGLSSLSALFLDSVRGIVKNSFPRIESVSHPVRVGKNIKQKAEAKDALFLCGLMIVGCMTVCASGKPEQTPGSTAKEETPAQDAAQAEEKARILSRKTPQIPTRIARSL